MEINIGGTRRLHEGALRAREFIVERERGVGRKDLMAAARECAEGMRLRPSVRLVLCELAACYGEQALDRGLMVWPSNSHLSRRTGLVERTIRKCVADLVQLAILEPCDSANRKRFAVRSDDGAVVDAFGFNLAPLYARRQEWTALLMRQRVEREARGRIFDEITIARKATEEALRAAAACGATDASLASDLASLIIRTPRRGSTSPIDRVLEHWISLRKQAEDHYLAVLASCKDSGSGGSGFRHKETNKYPSTESCQEASRDEEVAKPRQDVPTPLLVEACPAAEEYGERLTTRSDVIRLGRYLRPSIGAHPDAWSEAETGLGAASAAALVLYVLQLVTDDGRTGHGRIRNPGGLFRDLARRMMAGTLDLGDELRRMRRKRLQ